MTHKTQSGFSLIETMVYIGILSLFITTTLVFMTQFSRDSTQQNLQLQQQANLARITQKLSVELKQAQTIESIQSDNLCFTDANNTFKQFYFQNNNLWMAWGGADCNSFSNQAVLNDSSIQISSANFEGNQNQGSLVVNLSLMSKATTTPNPIETQLIISPRTTP